jgi:two-component system NtrC family response regulator
MENGKRKLLIVDDDEGIQNQLRWAFDECDVVLAGDREQAMDAVSKENPHVVLLDLGLPPDPDGPSEGLATLQGILSVEPDTKIIVVSGQTEREYAVRAVGLGAYDFYQKPIEHDPLNLTVQRAFNLYDLEAENVRLAAQQTATKLPGIVTANHDMAKICDDVGKFAVSDVTVLLIGESGTGKEVLTRAIHQLSPRAEGPLVAINCAAIPENLLESELFGHEKGAFTGASKTTMGKVEQANKGTLFLDEIGDMPMSLQAKMLRFLEERSVVRVGGRREIPVDIRVVSATNKNLQEGVADNTFREDLYYRLAETVIKIPPLRDRPDDALLIANHFLKIETQKHNKAARSFSPDALTAIADYEWPGNIRELQNRLRRAILTATGNQITASDLEFTPAADGGQIETLKECRERAERLALARAMLQADGNISKVAKLLDTSRPTIYQLMQRYEITV